MNRRAFLSTPLLALPALGQALLPRPSGELAITTLDGRQVLLSQHRGKVVCVEFLLTTCPHCQQTANMLSRFQRDLGSRGFQALGAAFNDDAQMMLPDFIRTFAGNFPVGMVRRGTVLDFQKYQSEARLMVPQLALVDRKGFVRYQSNIDATNGMHEEKSLREKVELLLKETGSPVSAAKKTTKK
jgi:hypothetical protein